MTNDDLTTWRMYHKDYCFKTFDTERMLKSVARQKFRFDTGAGYLSVGTFCIVAGDGLSRLFGGTALWKAMLCVPVAIVGAWIIGYVSQRLKFTKHMNDVCNQENPAIQKLLEKDKL